MVANGSDAAALLVKIPGASVGPLALQELGGEQLGYPGWTGKLVGGLFWNWYSKKAGEQVDGWIGSNVLKSFRLTLDYPSHTSYWLAQAPLDTHALDQVGVVLERTKGITAVAGIARKNGAATVTGVQAGDKLLKIGDLQTASATRGQLLSALHGNPGEMRHIVLERGGQKIEIDAPVTGF